MSGTLPATTPAATGIDPIRSTEIVEGTLSMLSNATEAEKIKNLPGFKVFDGTNYVSAADRKIDGNSILRVAIDVPEEVNGKVELKTHYYRRLNGRDGDSGDSKSGLKATAYVETDVKGNALTDANGQVAVHLGFGGYTGKPGDGSKQTDALNAIARKELNPQAIEAAAFTEEVIKQVGKDKVSGVIFGSHSLGASNALSAQVVTDLEGVKSKTDIIIEPVMANLEKGLLERDMNDPNSAYSKGLQTLTKKSSTDVQNEVTTLENHIDPTKAGSNTVSIREGYLGADGLWHGTVAANLKMPGQNSNVMMAGMSAVMAHDKTDLLTLDAANPDNAMVGKKIIQDNTNDQINLRTGGIDPNHELANITYKAYNDKFLELNGNKLEEFKQAGNAGTQTATTPAATTDDSSGLPDIMGIFKGIGGNLQKMFKDISEGGFFGLLKMIAKAFSGGGFGDLLKGIFGQDTATTPTAPTDPAVDKQAGDITTAKIGGMLSALSNVTDAKKIADLPGIEFGVKKADGTIDFKSAASDPSIIKDDALNFVKITAADGDHIFHKTMNASGLATSWEELNTDGTKKKDMPLIIAYAPDDPTKDRTAEAAKFAHDAYAAHGGTAGTSSVLVVSLGERSDNAVAGQVAVDMSGSTKGNIVAFDDKDMHAAMERVNALLQNKDSGLSKELQKDYTKNADDIKKEGTSLLVDDKALKDAMVSVTMEGGTPTANAFTEFKRLMTNSDGTIKVQDMTHIEANLAAGTKPTTPTKGV